MRGLYAAIVFNLVLWLVLWLAVLGAAGNEHPSVKTFAAIGVVGAAVSQHWAYYALRRSRIG